MRNSLNGAAINAEVIRSRLAKGNATDLEAFAERVALEVNRATGIGTGIAALARLVAIADRRTRMAGDGSVESCELVFDALPRDYELPRELEQLATIAGLTVERTSSAVIFKGSAISSRLSNAEA